MMASALVAALMVEIVKHGDRRVVDMDGCDPVTGVTFSETSQEEMGDEAPIYLRVYR